MSLHGNQVLVVTPFKPDYQLDEASLSSLIDHLVAQDVAGIIALGTTGEFFSLTDSEKRRVIDVAAERIGDRSELMRGLAGKTAVVTGAAAGIGHAIATRFAEEQCALWLLDRSEAVFAVAHELERQSDVRCRAMQVDIRDERSVSDTFREIGVATLAVDVLVNNTVLFARQGVDATVDDWNALCSVNVIGTSLVPRFCLPLMVAAGGGAVVNLSSISGLVGHAQFAVYNATKFAVRGLTKCWAIDFARHNIRVNSVCPGYIASTSGNRYIDEHGLDAGIIERRLAQQHILGRLGRPEEVAAAVCFLASQDASFITGADLLVDGGYVAK